MEMPEMLKSLITAKICEGLSSKVIMCKGLGEDKAAAYIVMAISSMHPELKMPRAMYEAMLKLGLQPECGVLTAEEGAEALTELALSRMRTEGSVQ